MEDVQPQQQLQPKPASTFSMKGVNLKQGVRSVMNANRLLAGGLPSVALKDDTSGSFDVNDHHPSGEDTELSVEDLEIIPRVVGDLREASLELTDSKSLLGASLHQKYAGNPFVLQDSPRGPEEWAAASGATATTAASSFHRDSLLCSGSDSNLPGYGATTNTFPISPTAATPKADQMVHPQSGPAALQTFGPTPKSHGKKGLLRKTIKMSAIKTFVGKGLDLSSSHHVVSRPNPAQTKNNHKQAVDTTSSVHRVVLTEDASTTDHARRHRRDSDGDDMGDAGPDDIDFSSPRQVKGVTGKMASKMRKSIIGWKVMAGMKGKNAAAMLLEDEGTASTGGGGVGSDSPPFLVQPPSQGEMLIADVANDVSATSVNESKLQLLQEAKTARLVRHTERRARRGMDDSSHLNSESNHALIDDKDNTIKRSRPSQRAGRQPGKLDSKARQRLRKHSEGNGLRHRSAATRLRREQVLATSSRQDTERTSRGANKAAEAATVDTVQEPLQGFSSHSQNGPDGVPPKPVNESDGAKLLRAPSGEGPGFARKTKKDEEGGESQPSARKLKKLEDDKLRGRVRRNSLMAQLREPSISVLDIVDDDGASFAEDHSVGVSASAEQEEPTHKEPSPSESAQQEVSLKNLFQSAMNASNGSSVGATSTKGGSSSNGLNVSSSTSFDIASMQGSSQRVESVRTSDYFQLKIDGVPLKQGSPEQKNKATEVETTDEKRLRPGRSKTKFVDDTMDASKPRRHHKGSRKQGAAGEKKESRRHADKTERKPSGRKPRAESSKRRTHSPRRNSDENHTRRQKADRVRSGNASLSALSSLAVASDGSPGNAAKLESEKSDGELGASYSSNLVSEVGSSNFDASSRSEVVDKVDGEQLEEGQMDDSKGDARRRRVTKARRSEQKKTSRVGADSVGGGSKCSTAASAMAGPPEKQRPKTRGQRNPTKKAPSSRGRSEGRRESKKTPCSKPKRRHSLEARKRVAVATMEDETNRLNEDLGKSLSGIKW